MLPFIEPQVFKSFDDIDDLFAILKLFSACIVIALYLKGKISPLVIGMTVLQIWIGAATLINEGSIVRFAGPAITSVITLMVAEMALKADFLFFLRGIRNLLTIYFIINIVSIMFIQADIIELPYPFLGMDNRWIYFFLPWITLSFAVDALSDNKISIYSWATLFASILQLVLVWSVGAMLTIMLWCLLWICSYWRQRRGKRQISKYAILFIIISVVLLNTLLINGMLLDWFGGFISNVFNKDVTLSGRTLIWNKVLLILESSPLLGEGVQSELYDVNLFTSISPSNPAFWVNHPHNFFLNIAFHGGWFAAVLFSIICFGSMVPLAKCNNSYYARSLFCGMICFFAASLVDTLDFSLFYLLIALSIYPDSKKIISNETAE